MSRIGSAVRLALFVVLAVALGYFVEKDPGETSLPLPDKGFTVTVPNNVEGWQLERGTGAVLVTGHTRLNTMSLEIVEVPITQKEAIATYISERESSLRAGKAQWIVWHVGDDYKFGNRYAPAFKATYSDRFLIFPVKAETWVYDVYWPYQGHFVRITMHYPNMLADYVQPDKLMLAAGLRGGLK